MVQVATNYVNCYLNLLNKLAGGWEDEGTDDSPAGIHRYLYTEQTRDRLRGSLAFLVVRHPFRR